MKEFELKPNYDLLHESKSRTISNFLAELTKKGIVEKIDSDSIEKKPTFMNYVKDKTKSENLDKVYLLKTIDNSNCGKFFVAALRATRNNNTKKESIMLLLFDDRYGQMWFDSLGSDSNGIKAVVRYEDVSYDSYITFNIRIGYLQPLDFNYKEYYIKFPSLSNF
ncbi:MULTISPECIES: hypothetical protein [unclassified Campylobacter]|uniref:hypothetical protein n=1 Tax=unclassified Campylobacter TaxID=2593542 RepID=UPI0014754ECE|nr:MULTISPECIES: hypothetical protein [unclassified Campylobacter]